MDLLNLKRLIKVHYAILKANFIYCASNSHFPDIDIHEFTSFCKKLRIYDHNIDHSTTDRHFIAVNVELTTQVGNPDKALIRFEFIELLIRIAWDKFVRFGTVKTYTEAFQLMLDDHIIPFGEP